MNDGAGAEVETYVFEDDLLKQREYIETAYSTAMKKNSGVSIPKDVIERYRGIYNDPAVKLAVVIREFYRDNLQGKKVDVNIVDGVIEVAFCSDGRGKSTKGVRLTPEKAATYEYLDRLLRNGEYAYSQKNRKAGSDAEYANRVPYFHYFVNNANVDGADIPVKVQARELNLPGGVEHRYYTHGFVKNRGDASDGLAD